MYAIQKKKKIIISVQKKKIKIKNIHNIFPKLLSLQSIAS